MKKIIVYICFLSITQVCFAGWSREGTKFYAFDGVSKVVSCKYWMSGDVITRNINVWFEITDVKNKTYERLNLFNWSLDKDSLDIKTEADIPIKGSFKKNLLVFYNANNDIQFVNIKTRESLWHGDKWDDIADVKLSDSLTYVAFSNGDLRLSKNNSGQKIKTIRISSSIKNIDINSDNNLFTLINQNDDAFIYNLKSLSPIDSIQNCKKIVVQNKNEIILESKEGDLKLYNLSKKKGVKVFSIDKLKEFDIISILRIGHNHFAIEIEDEIANTIILVNKFSEEIELELLKEKQTNYNGSTLLGFSNNNIITNLGCTQLVEEESSYGVYIANLPCVQDVSEIIDVIQDNESPKITINFPELTSEKETITQDNTLFVKGIASDSSTIKYVSINEIEIPFLPKTGEFNGYIKLNEGENLIEVKAIDYYNNVAQTSIKVLKSNKKNRGAKPISLEKDIDPLLNYSYHALIIAEQDYEDKRIKDLSHPILDAKNLKDILIENYSFEQQNIQIKINPKRNEIIQSFDSLLYKLSSQDHLLIFFAGHGVYDEKLKRGYWLPSDAELDNKANWVSNNDIRDYISGIETKHTLLITDACFSGSIFEYDRNIDKEQEKIVKTLLNKKSRTAMTSGLDQVVPDKSVFLQYFLKYLIENPKEYITANELFNELYDAVISNTDNNPQYGVIKDANHEGGEFIFLRKQ